MASKLDFEETARLVDVQPKRYIADFINNMSGCSQAWKAVYYNTTSQIYDQVSLNRLVVADSTLDK